MTDPVQDLAARMESPKTDAKRRLEALETAKEFEQIFVRQMVGAMRDSAKIDPEEGGMFGSEVGSDTYADWFDDHVAQTVGKGDRLGIASSLMRDYDRTQELVRQELARRNGEPTTAPAKADHALDSVQRDRLRAPRLPTRAEGGLDVTG